MTTETIRTGWRICVICGAEGYDVLPSLAKLSKPGPDGPYQTVTRCKDSSGCRARCEDQGDAWPIDDSTPRYRLVGEDPA